MHTVIDEFTQGVGSAFAACGYEAKYGMVQVSDRIDLSPFQCNGAFAAAKQYHKAPAAIAGEVASALEGSPLFSKAEPAGPGFLNLTPRDEWLAAYAAKVAQDSSLGIPQIGQGETILIDYGGPNVAKPLHIGHLRSAIIGEALKRIARACGYRVISDIHLGDWGLQIGLVIAELSDRHPEWRCFASDFGPERESVPPLDPDMLSEVYPFANARSKEDPAFRERAKQATVKLQEGHAGYRALWQELMRVSVADLKQNYEKLGVSFDLWYGESDSDQYILELMQILESQNLLRLSDGALVVDVAQAEDKAPVPPVIVKKSDHSNIYATTDLATLLQRQRDFAPDRIWYVVDNRQSLHFTQVFRCAKKAGVIPLDTELQFLGFGTMNGPDGRPYKTRDGGLMRLEDLIHTVTSAARTKMETSSFLSEGEQEECARKIGIAAIKFGDLVNQRTKDYIFDLEKFLSFEGKTGTYLLYTVTRICSVLKKVGTAPMLAPTRFYSDTERMLITQLLLSGDVFCRAISERAPNEICEHAYQIASLFSRFYHDSHVLSEQDLQKRGDWVALMALTKRILELHLKVLGIEPVDHM